MPTMAVHLDNELHQRLLSHANTESASCDRLIAEALASHFDDLETETIVMPTHPDLIPGYRLPAVPDDFDKPCAVSYNGSHVELDFVNLTRRDFASESEEVSLVWPWRAGFTPTEADWESIGFWYLAI